jgi:hypothetical protein
MRVPTNPPMFVIPSAAKDLHLPLPLHVLLHLPFCLSFPAGNLLLSLSLRLLFCLSLPSGKLPFTLHTPHFTLTLALLATG